MTRVDNTPREPAIRRLECQAKAPEAAKTGRWGEGQKKIQDVL